MHFIPDIPGETICMQSIANATNATTEEITRPFASYISWASALDYTQRTYMIPCAGTIKKFYGRIATNPGTAPNAYTIGIYKKTDANASVVVTDLVVSVTSANYSGFSNTSDTITVAKGDFIAVGCVPTDTPATSWSHDWGFVFVPDEPGNTLMGGSNSHYQSSPRTEQRWSSGNRSER